MASDEQSDSIYNMGKFMSEASLLGPFCRLSVFAEDDPQIVDRYFPETNNHAIPSANNEISPETFNLIAKQVHPLLGSARVRLCDL